MPAFTKDPSSSSQKAVIDESAFTTETLQKIVETAVLSFGGSESNISFFENFVSGEGEDVPSEDLLQLREDRVRSVLTSRLSPSVGKTVSAALEENLDLAPIFELVLSGDVELTLSDLDRIEDEIVDRYFDQKTPEELDAFNERVTAATASILREIAKDEKN